MRFENFNWIRQADGLIKKTPNGGYVMINEVGCCYGFSVEKLDDFREMFEELEKQHIKEQCELGNHNLSSQRTYGKNRITGADQRVQRCWDCRKYVPMVELVDTSP